MYVGSRHFILLQTISMIFNKAERGSQGFGKAWASLNVNQQQLDEKRMKEERERQQVGRDRGGDRDIQEDPEPLEGTDPFLRLCTKYMDCGKVGRRRPTLTSAHARGSSYLKSIHFDPMGPTVSAILRKEEFSSQEHDNQKLHAFHNISPRRRLKSLHSPRDDALKPHPSPRVDAERASAEYNRRCALPSMMTPRLPRDDAVKSHRSSLDDAERASAEYNLKRAAAERNRRYAHPSMKLEMEEMTSPRLMPIVSPLDSRKSAFATPLTSTLLQWGGKTPRQVRLLFPATRASRR